MLKALNANVTSLARELCDNPICEFVQTVTPVKLKLFSLSAGTRLA